MRPLYRNSTAPAPRRIPIGGGAPIFPRSPGEVGNPDNAYAQLKRRPGIRLTIGQNLFRARLYYFPRALFSIARVFFLQRAPGRGGKIKHVELRFYCCLQLLFRDFSEVRFCFCNFFFWLPVPATFLLERSFSSCFEILTPARCGSSLVS